MLLFRVCYDSAASKNWLTEDNFDNFIPIKKTYFY